MRNITLSIIAIFMLSSMPAKSQSNLDINVGIGTSYGLNESIPSERVFGFVAGAGLIWNNGIMRGLSPELNFAYYTNGTADDATFSEYSTTYIAPELRLRYEIALPNPYWEPYVYTGIGVTMFTVDEVPENKTPEAETEGTLPHIPVGAGITYWLNNDLGLDANISYNYGTTDDYNPVHDDLIDANWNVRVGVQYTIADFALDSDGDGLSDEEEARLGTDPNNPDTDGDGLLDGEEVYEYETDPTKADTDGGGIPDGVEVRNGADPLDYADDIVSVPVGSNIIVRNLEFETGKAQISDRSERILNGLLKAMRAAPQKEFLIIGHTDDVGERDNNMILSRDRAEAVKNWLIGQGIDAGRLETEGKGPDQPLVPNTDAESRQTNRRVEFQRTK